jgi:hypothetical protein
MDEADRNIEPDREATRKVKPVKELERSETFDHQELVRPQPARSISTAERISSAMPAPVEGKARTGADARLEEKASGRSLEDQVPPPDRSASPVIVRELFVPLVTKVARDDDKAAVLAEGPRQAIVQTPKPAIADFGNLPRREGTGRQMAPEREPEEIQIHIGRIEVTATTPTPVRPAPVKSARKTLTLDDYLKQRHGRA